MRSSERRRRGWSFWVDERPNPVGRVVTEKHDPTVFEDSNGLVGVSQITVVEHPYVWQPVNGQLEIPKRSVESRQQFVVWNVVSTLRNSHRNTLNRLLWPGETDETEDDGIASGDAVLKKLDLIANGIRKHRFKHKALSTRNQGSPQAVSEPSRSIGFDREFVRQDIGIYETQP